MRASGRRSERRGATRRQFCHLPPRGSACTAAPQIAYLVLVVLRLSCRHPFSLAWAVERAGRLALAERYERATKTPGLEPLVSLLASTVPSLLLHFSYSATWERLLDSRTRGASPRLLSLRTDLLPCSCLLSRVRTSCPRTPDAPASPEKLFPVTADEDSAVSKLVSSSQALPRSSPSIDLRWRRTGTALGLWPPSSATPKRSNPSKQPATLSRRTSTKSTCTPVPAWPSRTKTRRWRRWRSRTPSGSRRWSVRSTRSGGPCGQTLSVSRS